MNDITANIRAGRRHALLGQMAATAGATIATTSTASAARYSSSYADGADKLALLTSQLAKSPRRRDFSTVPMVLDDPGMWDTQALDLVIAYRGERRQVWDNTEIDSPWLNLMRNSLNAQVFSFGHPDFLAVSATHGSAHFALYDQTIWDKYKLTKLAGPLFASNTLIKTPDGALDASAHEGPEGLFGAAGNTIPTLQKRGVVFMACHNAIWEQTSKLIKQGVNPDRLSHEQLAAELTNHLIDGVVLTPGIVATIPELQHAGFGYVK